MNSILKRLYLVFALSGFSMAAEFHGVVSTHHTGKADRNSTSSDFIAAEERSQLRVSGSEGGAGFLGKIDFFHEDISGRNDFEIREGYVTYSTGVLDLRLGRQVLTWGVGDMLFINDLFPKDYVSLFIGKNHEYLKGAISGLKGSIYSEYLSVDLAVIPFFASNRLPSQPGFQIKDPFSEISNRIFTLPEKRLENSELALRIFRSILYWDVSIYGYRGYFRNPSIVLDSWTTPTRLDFVYPELNAVGLSAQGGGLGGVLSFESGYYDSPEDRNGDNPLIPNSEIRYLLGYQFAPWPDFMAGIQYYGEYMMEYSKYASALPSAFPDKDELRQVLVLRLTQFVKYQTLKLSILTFYSPTDEDYFLIPEVTYRLTDQLAVSFGGNIFEGPSDHTDFGMMDANDNAYLSLRYEF